MMTSNNHRNGRGRNNHATNTKSSRNTNRLRHTTTYIINIRNRTTAIVGRVKSGTAALRDETKRTTRYTSLRSSRFAVCAFV